MQLNKLYKSYTLASCIIFFGFGITTLCQQDFAWILAAFLWVLSIPFLKWFIKKTEDFFWLLLILLPLSTELNPTASLGLDFPVEPILCLLTVAAFGYLLFKPTVFFEVLKSKVWIFILVWLLWISVTIFFSTQQWLSVKFLLAKIWYIIPLVLLTPVFVKESTHFKKIGLCLCIPMLFTIIQTLIRHSFYGFDFIAIKKTLHPFFRNHVNYASMLVCLLPLAWLIHKFTPAHSRNRKLVNIGLLIAGFGLFFAYSRGAWLALIVGLLAAWLIRKKIIFKTIIAAMVLIVICITTLSYQNNYLRFAPEHDQTIFHTDFRDHINATVTLKDISNAERFHRWVAGIRMVAEKPFTGFGPNSFYSQYQPYTVSSFKTWVSNNPEHSTVHNYFLLTAIEQGILGLILLLAFWMYLLIQSQTLYHQFKNKFHQAIALANGTLLSMIACINFTSDLIETDKIGGLFWLSVGIIIILEIKLKQEQQPFY
ncbi:MAG: hypothetical protein EAZ13_07820 [Sphingobacteriia bacterium]|nr:MAG: hypothetical protein EAZ13_07820 [Sphingobacteriia bacterium]